MVDGERVEGEVHIVNGVRTLCTEGPEARCIVLDDTAQELTDDDDGEAAATSPAAVAPNAGNGTDVHAAGTNLRLLMGTRTKAEMLDFLGGGAAAQTETPPVPHRTLWVFLLAVCGGFCLNLTPCVLPMVPVTLMIIGRSPARGLGYAAGMTLAYGALGALAVLGGASFGAIQGNPWFNAAIAAVFTVLGAALCGAFFIDFSRARNGLSAWRGKMLPGLFAFFMGAVGAVLAGACVAPVLLATLAQAAVYAQAGSTATAIALPFALGVGMALPWPFAAAGMKVLPKPGRWMRAVNFAFAFIVFAFAANYARLSYLGFAGSAADRESISEAELPDVLSRTQGPVFIDCWAQWCKNCRQMERTVLAEPEIRSALEPFTVIKVEVHDMDKLRQVPGCERIIGLPAYLVRP